MQALFNGYYFDENIAANTKSNPNVIEEHVMPEMSANSSTTNE